MKSNTLVFLFITAISIILSVGCGSKDKEKYNTQNNSLQNSNLFLNMSLGRALELGYNITKVNAKITKNNFFDSTDLTISGNSASGTFIGLEPGIYTINVNMYQNDTIIATGSGTGNVMVGQTTTVNITMINPVKHNITASTGTGGSISPLGTTTVNNGSSLTFTITPNSGYSISDIKVDGSSVGAASTYSFTNVTVNHTIEATFTQTSMGYETTINVSIQNNGFSPVYFKISSSWSYNLATSLSNVCPSYIIKEPNYNGLSQRYGFLKLGTKENNIYYFVLDLISGSNPLMYFDKNQNGNLTDDGTYFTNQGTSFFATKIEITFSQILPQTNFSGNYSLWFFTNDSLWEDEKVAHYSQTQLKGKVKIDGKEYLTYFADRNYNDADFTNDGIYIDIDGNNNIDFNTEHFNSNELVEINGKSHKFIVTW